MKLEKWKVMSQNIYIFNNRIAQDKPWYVEGGEVNKADYF